MIHHPLEPAVRLLLSLAVLVFLVTLRRGLFRAGPPPLWLDVSFALAFLVALAFTYLPVLRDTLAWTFPIGGLLGWAAAGYSLARPRARAAFDRIADADARVLLSFRMIFGVFVFLLAAVGAVPNVFALTAGVGDLIVGGVALSLPGPLDERGSRLARTVVHGLGTIDMLQVAFMAITVVRPWSIANGNTATFMALPWIAVPAMFALNAHGIRQACFTRVPRAAEPRGDGSESPRRVRGALPGA
ncbi:MAG TPA: hypothetical protein VLT33_19045 [Labilithrix sp.]|nr:hypothetical protein [Labilithrix sp.]